MVEYREDNIWKGFKEKPGSEYPASGFAVPASSDLTTMYLDNLFLPCNLVSR